MEYQEYLGIKQEIYEHFMNYIDTESNIEIHFSVFIKIIEKTKCEAKASEFKTLLHLISEIDKNHYRSNNFFNKIERILSHYEKYIKQSFTNEELLQVFCKNPRILHFLIKNSIITVDVSMIKLLYKEHQSQFVIRQFPDEKKPDYESEEKKHNSKKLIYSDYKYYFYLDVNSKLSETERSRSSIR